MQNTTRSALHMVLVFSGFGVIWVVLSNDFLASFASDAGALARYHTYLEWFYVLIAAFLLFSLVNRALKRQAVTEHELRESKGKLQLFIDHAPAALAMFDRQMRYLAVSNRWIADYSLSGQPVIGRSHYELFPDIPEHWKVLYSRGMAGEVLRADNDIFKRQDGAVQWLQWEIRPWYADDGHVGGVVIFSVDITARKRAEEALSESEKKYRLLFDNSRDALMINAPPSWGMRSVNQSALRMFGVASESEFASLTLWDISTEYQPDGTPSEEKAQRIVDVVLRDGYHFFEWMFRRKDGTAFPAEVSLTRVELNGRTLIQGAVRDISVRKNLEKEMLERQQTMETLQKSQIAAQTAAAIAHELRQPLLAISSYGEAALLMLQAEKPNLAGIGKAVEGMERQALRAGEEIQELLELLRMEEFPTENFDLNQEIVTVLELAKSARELKFQSKLLLDEELPLVHANRMHIQKVLSNLLHNSIDAMYEVGVPLPSITIAVNTRRDESLAQVTIQDNGPGFKAENIHRLFEPFFTTKPQGIGMGLVISRSLIEANGGQLWVDPQEGPGATFHLTLPFTT